MTHASDNPPPVRYGVVAVIRREGRYLVIRRSSTVAAPGAYCFPGGGIESGESEAEALRRELQEELGVDSQPERCVWRSMTRWRVALSWWETQLAESAMLVPNPAEVAGVYWFTAEEMLGLPDLLSSNREFLEVAARGEDRLESSNDETRMSNQ